ncbi:bifunctional diguanylate cyclase/phosphodiesterase [Rhodoferax antarcticus]|uniref:bifunctional diguanylate cyclase/phosphodiesterase n=1 Tax=Rhodoferax antarcticus TaxID=81479 RepID=UPI0022242E7C|nr:EAL domain-containing protein [Rhodoferax antarcticus]MCW2311555.1 diguanylate cyclase (GGDEF)-like protein [Rhodoferax antarcticus]
MSMYRQLWLAIIVSTLLALCGSMLASMLSARSYLQSQLSIKNADNATALALSLSQSNPDPVMVELVVSSMFDRGHYERISVTDPAGAVMVTRVATEVDLNAPRWFVRALPIHADPGLAQISNGWKQFGTVTLVSHSRFAYAALWKSAQQVALALILAGLVGGYLGSLVLRRLRKPLDAVIGQANAITNRRFVTIEEPEVPELKQLASAMNATVKRLKSMFEEEAARLDKVRQDANCDPLTGLANRSYFLARLREASIAQDSAGESVIIARLANLAVVNQTLGRAATDELLCRFGSALEEVAALHPEALAARLNGADFALLLPGTSRFELTKVAKNLLSALTSATGAFVPDKATTWLGGGYFPPGMEVDNILAQVDAALAAAELEARDGLHFCGGYDNEALPKSAKDWATIIQRALSEKWVRLVSFPVMTLEGGLIHRECPLRLMFDAHGEWHPAGYFLPVAERLKLTPQLDLAAVELGLTELENKPNLTGLAINLSASSIQLPEFRAKLRKALLSRPGTSRLWLEVSEAGALVHFEAFRALCQELRDLKCQIGLEHFGRQFSEFGRFHDLGLDYLKVDASFIRGIHANAGNQAFLRGLSAIAHSIGLTVIAEGAASADDLRALSAVGFDGATGPVVTDVALA